MLIINKNKKIVDYKFDTEPIFKNRISEMLWLRNQKNKARLINIKSISIQIKDVKQMKYSSSTLLNCLYAKFDNSSYLDDEYITIKKQGNKHILLAILNTDWIIVKNKLDNMSLDEIKKECIELEEKMLKLKTKKMDIYSLLNYDDYLKLLEYQKSCLLGYINQDLEISNENGFQKVK